MNSNMGPSHRLQLFPNCPNMGPLHGVQSFRNNCSSTRSQALSPNLLQHGLPSPWGHRSCQEALLAWFSHGDNLLQASPCSSLQFLHLQVDLCPAMDLHCMQGHSCLTKVFSIGCRRISALAPGQPSPPPPLILVSAGLFLSQILTLFFSGYNCFPTLTTFPFLNLLSQRPKCALERKYHLLHNQILR